MSMFTHAVNLRLSLGPLSLSIISLFMDYRISMHSLGDQISASKLL